MSPHAPHAHKPLPARSGDVQHPVDDLLLSGLEISASLFHLGQYCDYWESSLSGQRRAGFHLVLHGPCWLHIQDKPSVQLHPGDAVFFLRDIAHRLSAFQACPAFDAPLQRQAMQALAPSAANSTGLLCGFLDLGSGLGELLLANLPDMLLLRNDADNKQTNRPLYELILAEVHTQSRPNPRLLEKLVEMLLFYTLRSYARQAPGHDTLPHGLINLAREPAFGKLLEQLVQAPARDWTVDDMAGLLNMSRAAFHRRFTLLCGLAPAQVLLQLRMQLARRYLAQGLSMEQVAEQIGYGSAAAFSTAFRRSTGVSPAQWRKQEGR
ncbi:MAG TPA: AraC family transcriptional regulator [Alcaligenes sp.]|nr:AraC family transcriptional regulator [Alcaligenes sp.]HRL27977.1 AraC family transcriptional regulator [Alcaligenes sp.]